MIAVPFDRDELLATLRGSHDLRCRVEVLNANDVVTHALDAPASSIAGGEVLVESFADITRSLTLELADEHRQLGFDAASPAKGALFANQLVRVWRGVRPSRDSAWMDVPVFTGPVTGFERDGSRVRLEAQGKEALALAPHLTTAGYTLRKGERVDDAIEAVMRRIGERRFNLPRMGKRLQRNRAVEPEDEPWDVVKFGWQAERVVKRGKGKNRRRERVTVDFNGLVSLQGAWMLFYDGLGYLTARPRARTVVATFAEGDTLEDRPTVKFDALAALNTVIVEGATVTVGKKPNRKQVTRRAKAVLPAAHPLSPQSLARNSVKRQMTEIVQADNLKTDAGCRELAERILAERSQDGLELSFSALANPLLEELDVVRVQTAEYALDVRLDRFTIPLTAEALMTAGYDR